MNNGLKIADSESPILNELHDRFKGCINDTESYIMELNSKLNNIRTNLETKEEPPINTKSSCFTEALGIQIERLDHINGRLRKTLNHLNTII